MKRLDKFDYEALGAREWWYLNEALDAFTSLEMEVRELFAADVCGQVYTKIWNKYYNYLSELIYAGILLGDTPEEEWGLCHEDGCNPSIVINTGTTCIVVDDLIKAIAGNNNKVKIKIDILTQLLSGNCVGQISIATYTPNDFRNDVKRRSETCALEITSVIEPEYRFQKINNIWNLQYKDAKIPAVKDWLGMNYIKLLLSSPGTLISVFDLQRKGGGGDQGDLPMLEGKAEGEDDNYTSDCVEAWASVDEIAKKSYLDRLTTINVEITDARKRLDQEKIDMLIKEAEIIQRVLQEGSGKQKDPEVEKNRKRVRKAIMDAITNIRKLEMAYNYNDYPISNHLRRHIKTGAYCSYTPNAEEYCSWAI